jgi:hypothetical protein
MGKAFIYHVQPDPDGWGWIVAAEGYVVHSLPYDSREVAIEEAIELVHMHPGSVIRIDERPPLLSPVEIEHRMAA